MCVCVCVCISYNTDKSALPDIYVLVISRYEDDIVVITRDRGGAEVECNNNDIIRV